MKSTITELLPLAVVIAISPVPILAVIMMLLTDRERANPLAFLAGWICILTVLVTGAILSGADSVSTTPSKPVAVVFLVVAVGLIALAIHEWRRRPRKGEPQRIEPWTKFLHTVTPARAFALGVGLVIDFFGLAAKNSGMPVEFIYPSMTAIVPASIALVAGAKSPEGGKRFIQFTLSDEGQTLLLQKDISRLPVLPATYAKAPAG